LQRSVNSMINFGRRWILAENARQSDTERE